MSKPQYVRIAPLQGVITHEPEDLGVGPMSVTITDGRTIPLPGTTLPIPVLPGRTVVSAPQPAIIPLVTTEEAISLNRQALSMITPETEAKIEQKQQQQRKIEEEYFKQSPVCSIQKLSSNRNRLGNLQTQEVKSLLRNKFYDPAVMRTIMCSAESIAYTSPVQLGGVNANERIRHWLDNLKRVGAESVEGVALKADLAQADNVFIVKAPRDPANTELLHEAFVGMYALNSLRQYVPNFAYIMGAFKCSLPIVDNESKDVVAWCNNMEDGVNYVIYENIFPGQDLNSYNASDCDFNKWLGYFLQILYALLQANDKVGFTHNDLHDQNVILRDQDGKVVAIPYITEDGRKKYLLTDKIATIIDYGMSHVQVGQHHFGVYDKTPYGVYPDRVFPLFDAYKLLLFSMFTMKNSGQTRCFNYAAIILRFFNDTETAEEIVDNQRKTYFYLPYTQATESLTIADLLHYIKNTFVLDNILVDTVPSGVEIVGCEGQTVCLSNQGVEAETGLIGPIVLRSAFDFYDVITRMQKEGRDDEIITITKDFNYVKARDEAIHKYDNLIRELTKKDNKLTSILSIENLPLQNILELGVLEQYKNFISKTADIFDTIQQLYAQREIISYMAAAYKDTNTVRKIKNSYDKYIREYKPRWTEIIDTIRNNNNYLQQLLIENGENINKSIRANPDMIWWWRYHPQLVEIIKYI